MNAKNRIIAVLVLSVAVCSCFAQGGGGRQGRGGRGRGNGLAQVLQRADVQRDLELTPDEISKLDELRQSQRGNRGGGGGGGGQGGGGGTPPDPAAMAARRAEQEKAVLAILTEGQQKRVKEIQLQLRGDEAVTSPEIQIALGITEEQKTKIKSIQDTAREANAAVREKMQSGEIDRAGMQAASLKNAQEVKDEIHKLLTPEQIAKLKDMGGKPFVQDPPAGGA